MSRHKLIKKKQKNIHKYVRIILGKPTKINTIINKFLKLPIWEKIPIVYVLFILLFCVLASLSTKQLQFSYSGQTCARQFILLPDLAKLSDDRYSFKNSGFLQIMNFKLLSTKTCFTAKKAPVSGSYKLGISLLGTDFLKKNFNIITPQPPTVSASVFHKPISISKPIEINLSNADSVFNYELKADSKTTDCPLDKSSIFCDISKIELLQGRKYDIQLVRNFNDETITTLLDTTIETVEATAVVNSSLSQNQMIYDNPRTFTFELNKTIQSGQVALEKISSDNRTAIPIQSDISDKVITVTARNDLDRNSTYEFTIDNIISSDGSTLDETYILGFNVSDGPSVLSTNVGTYGLPLSNTIVLTFDQPISPAQEINKFVSTSGTPTSIWKNENQVFIKYANAALCTDISIYIKSGLISNYDIVQNETWSYATRTICHTTASIGQSVEGRSILAHTFGGGSQTILYIGAMHGNELSGKYLMDAWIDELERNTRSIPSDKKIIIIPSLNPDGVIVNRRNNSNNVDLNRNFNTVDWQTDIYSPTNRLISGGGGSAPMSEPETQAIANYIQQTQPKLTLLYHAAANLLLANEAGNSTSFATTYSQLSGYRDATYESGTFDYKITGTLEGWMLEKYNLPAVLIELGSAANSEFARNRTALWAMAKS